MDKAEAAAIKTLAAKAELVLSGVLQQLGPRPTGWSGIIAMYQEARYGSVRYLKNAIKFEPRDSVTVLHPVVARSRTAASDKPGLNPSLFQLRASLVLFVRVRGGKLQTFDENYGVLPAKPEVLEEIARALR